MVTKTKVYTCARLCHQAPSTTKKTKQTQAGEMAGRLSAGTALAENPGSVPRTHAGWLTTASGRSQASSPSIHLYLQKHVDKHNLTLYKDSTLLSSNNNSIHKLKQETRLSA